MAAQCAAETLRLIDDFETIEWPRVDAGEFFGVGEENQPLTGSANLSLVPRNSSLGGSWALRVAYEVVCTVLLSSFFVLLDFVLTQQQREHQLLEGMRDHSETESGLPPGAAVPSEDMDTE